MIRNYLNSKILLGFFLVLAILGWMGVYSYLNTKKLISTSHRLARSYQRLHHSQRLLAVAVNLETGQRGYTLTGNDEFLEPYHQAINEIHDRFNALKPIATDSDVMVRRVRQLENDIKDLVDYSSRVVAARKESFQKAQSLNATLEGKKILDRIRTFAADLESEERLLQEQSVLENEGHLRKFNYSFIGLLSVSAVILVAMLLAVNTKMRMRSESEKRLVRAAEEIRDLYDNAPCGYHSLNAEGTFVEINNTLLRWLGYNSKDEVIGILKFEDVISPEDLPVFRQNYQVFKQKGYIDNVEFNLRRRDGSLFAAMLSSTAIYNEKGEFVKSRSNTFDNSIRKQADTQILNLNRELEAFTYSVSHDLRAPLRSIDGYSRILVEDYHDKLDNEGKRLIGVIVNNARRMGKLIDDLLEFSRLGRKDIQRTTIDMEAMARTIASEAIEQEGRKIELAVHTLDKCVGDVDMIRQVWVNLISNAIKYSGRNPSPEIVIRSFIENNEIHYSIADNGVGFDMQYEGKLFGVFQRLHRIQDFTGTGVGLAIVKRIITRHEGRVWAEGQVNQGATFHFTLPIQNG